MLDLTEREQEILEFMANGVEPTWLFLEEMPELGGDRQALEATLHLFEARGIVTHTRESSGAPEDRLSDLDDWWALTPLGKSAVRD